MSSEPPKKEWDFSEYSDEQLVERFNGDVGKPGWVAARGRFHHALFSEFKKRQIDCSCILSGNSVSLDRKVKLIGEKLAIDTAQERVPCGKLIFLEPLD